MSRKQNASVDEQQRRQPDQARTTPAAPTPEVGDQIAEILDILDTAAQRLRSATTEAAVLDCLRDVASAAADVQQAHTQILHARDGLLLEGRRRKITSKDLAQASGMSAPRLYQIMQRNGYRA